jgi:hypothetical protein
MYSVPVGDLFRKVPEPSPLQWNFSCWLGTALIFRVKRVACVISKVESRAVEEMRVAMVLAGIGMMEPRNL